MAAAVLLLAGLHGRALGASLYSGPGPRPGPAILYRAPAVAPQLTNSGVWQAPPILVSGASAYRDGEFLYQDFLYDDHGARETADPNDPRAANESDLFSKPNGTYTYPTGPGYANNAADLVEFRVKPLDAATVFRITLNTLENPSLIAFSIAIGGQPGHLHPFPDGANVVAPAALFLTVHPQTARRTTTALVADLVTAAGGRRVAGPVPSVVVDMHRRQIVVSVPHADWNPGRSTVRLAMGVGLWDPSKRAYMLPGATASATQPGGGGTAAHPAAFFNVAFRTHEPLPSVEDGPNAVLNAAWWRDREQGTALAAGNISPFYANVSFAKLARRVWDDSEVPRTGPFDRILASHFEPAQGANFSHECGLSGASSPKSCVPEYQGQLQPYAIYVPRGPRPRGGYGLTLLLHSLSAAYNQYTSSRNQAEFANRPRPSIVITPEARGPDQEYEGLGGADVFEVWADVARRYKLDPAYSEITGYSMGGIGTFKLAEQFPDLFAHAQPTVGDEGTTADEASLRNVPVLMWNNAPDELVNPAFYLPTARKLASLGYRYQLDVYQPCDNPKCLATPFPNHLQLAINDQYAPAAAFLDTALVDRNPAHVTYVVDASRDRPHYGIRGDHAYWVYGIKLRQGLSSGSIDALSHGFGEGDPTASGVKSGPGTLAGGYLGTLVFTKFVQTWGATPRSARRDQLVISASGVRAASIAVFRAHVDCRVKLHITTDGPLALTLAGCGRVVHAG